MRVWRPDRFDKPLDVDVVLTSYNVLVHSDKVIKKKWRRVFLDDAHLIRNESTQTSKVCGKLNAHFRYAVTGIPIQNSEFDLHPLLRFIGYQNGQSLRHAFIRREKEMFPYFDPVDVKFENVPVELSVAERRLYDGIKKYHKTSNSTGAFSLKLILWLRQICIDAVIIVSRPK